MQPCPGVRPPRHGAPLAGACTDEIHSLPACSVRQARAAPARAVARLTCLVRRLRDHRSPAARARAPVSRTYKPALYVKKREGVVRSHSFTSNNKTPSHGHMASYFARL